MPSQVTIEPADPREPQITALLQESHALMLELFPAEHNHMLSVEALRGPRVRFFAAWQGGKVLGTGALALCEGYGEIKALFTARAARGMGLGAQIMARLEAEAREAGLQCLKLETGDRLYAALRLYLREGFVPCPPFGGYAPNGTSIFMRKRLR